MRTKFHIVFACFLALAGCSGVGDEAGTGGGDTDTVTDTDTETWSEQSCDEYCTKLLECNDMITWDHDTCMGYCEQMYDDPAWQCAIDCDHTLPCETWNPDCFDTCAGA